MATEGNEAVFSVFRLLRLAEDLESDAVAISYASTILKTQPGCIERLHLTVRVGGIALEQSCRALEKCLSDGEPASSVVAAQCVARDGHALRGLEQFLSQQRSLGYHPRKALACGRSG